MNKKNISFFLFFFYLIPVLSAELPCSSDFMKGYVSSKLEDRFGSAVVSADVQNDEIIVYSWPNNMDKKEILSFLQSVSKYTIIFDSCYDPKADGSVVTGEVPLAPIYEEGDIIPEFSSFFPTLLAQPHILGYSVGYRTYDKVFKLSCIPVSIGDQFSLYQFKTVSKGSLYFGIEACVWAIFDGKTKSLDLLNADYYVAFPLTYINNKFSSRLRLYHQSSHLGDEYLIENSKVVRLNPSMEVLDLAFAYEFAERFTAFIGYARVLRCDDSFKVKPNNVYYGFNYIFDRFKVRVCNLEATPYVATYFSNNENNRWRLDSSLVFGYQWDKSYGHKLRLYVEGHDGYSAEGQFCKERTRYLAFKILYGY